MKSWQKYVAEVLGTFILVFGGSLAILAASGANNLAVAFGFGIALLGGLYAFGEVSGGHFNPIVSLGDVPRRAAERARHDLVLDCAVRRGDPRVARRPRDLRQPGCGQGDGDHDLVRRARVLPGADLLGDLRRRDPSGHPERPLRRQRAAGDPVDAVLDPRRADPVHRLVGEPGAYVRSRPRGRDGLVDHLDLPARPAGGGGHRLGSTHGHGAGRHVAPRGSRPRSRRLRGRSSSRTSGRGRARFPPALAGASPTTRRGRARSRRIPQGQTPAGVCPFGFYRCAS